MLVIIQAMYYSKDARSINKLPLETMWALKTKQESRGGFISRVKRYTIVGDYGSPRDGPILTPPASVSRERYFASITPQSHGTSTLGRYPHAHFKHSLHIRINSLLFSLSSALNVKGKLINKPSCLPTHSFSV